MRTREEVVKIVCGNVKKIKRKLRDRDFDEATAFVTDLGFDGLDCIDFVRNCEKDLEVEISDDRSIKTCSIGDFINLVMTEQSN